jgi:hypothetical protein
MLKGTRMWRTVFFAREYNHEWGVLQYQTVLEDQLLQFMDIHGCTYFLKDDALCHTSKCRKMLLAKQNFQIINCP